LVDARLAAHYEAEHIPGAISLPSTSSPADVAAFVARHGKDTVFTVYCGSAQCGMSHNLASLLAAQGCKQVKIMTGGFAEYRAAQSGAAQ
jgi:rhodanese-related sulfurtransferase